MDRSGWALSPEDRQLSKLLPVGPRYAIDSRNWAFFPKVQLDNQRFVDIIVHVMNDVRSEVIIARRSPSVGPAFLLSQVGAHAANRFGQMLSVMELTPQHAGLLRMLGSNAGMTQKGVSDLFGIFPSRLVVLLDELERKGLLQRRDDPADRRNYRLHLTANGRRALKRIGAITGELEDQLFASLSEPERKELTVFLERIVVQQRITPAVHPAYQNRDAQQGTTQKEK